APRTLGFMGQALSFDRAKYGRRVGRWQTLEDLSAVAKRRLQRVRRHLAKRRVVGAKFTRPRLHRRIFPRRAPPVSYQTKGIGPKSNTALSHRLLKRLCGPVAAAGLAGAYHGKITPKDRCPCRRRGAGRRRSVGR